MLKNREFWLSVPYFKEHEFACKCGCGDNNISHSLVEKLNKARYMASVPFKINSACRCKSHNKSVEGSMNSSHLKGYAVDIHINSSVDRFKILNSLILVGFSRIGVYKNFIHVDMDYDKTNDVIWYK